jgi:hypothetical protein
MAILKEFRSMAFENGGTLGRKAHRAAAVPTYDTTEAPCTCEGGHQAAASSAADE